MSNRLIEKGVEIIQKLEDLDVDFDKIVALSKLEANEIVDPSKIYNRLRRIGETDWKRILDIGEQTGNLSFHEVSVIKTVVQKLKRNESVDLKRLRIVEVAIDRLNKKFKMNY